MATYYVQTGAASNNSGGTDADDSLSRSGVDGVSTSDTTFESETANFVAGDAGRGIWINTTVPAWRIIASVTDENTVVLNTALASTQNNLSWKIGGSFLTIDLAQNKLAAGDTLYIAPGTYRETVVLDVSGSVGNVISYLGDPWNLQGFKTAAGVTIEPNPCIITAYTTNDTTNPAAVTLLDITSKDYLDFADLWFYGNQITISVTTSENLNFTRCYFYNVKSYNVFVVTAAVDTAANITLLKCIFAPQCGNNAIAIVLPTSASADYDVNILVQDSLTSGRDGASVIVTGTGAEAFFGGGVDVMNCTLSGENTVYAATAAKLSTTIPCTVYNSIILGNNGLRASTAGQIVEDYNIIAASTARTNVSAGGNSKLLDRALYLEMGQSPLFEFKLRPYCSPWLMCRSQGFGNQAGATTTDLFTRPRPSGSGVTVGTALAEVGCYGLHDYGVKETTTKDAGDASIKLTGPGDHEIRIPVDASATTISIKARFDSGTYGGANYPQAILLDATEIGVSTETETATVAASDAWETLTFTQFTPTAKGWVTIRLVNRGSGGDDICYFDTIAVT